MKLPGQVQVDGEDKKATHDDVLHSDTRLYEVHGCRCFEIHMSTTVIFPRPFDFAMSVLFSSTRVTIEVDTPAPQPS